jgi:DNA processing protein
MDALTRRYLALALTPGLGPRKIKLLTEHFGDAESVYRASESELLEVEGIGPKLAGSIITLRDSARVEHELARAAKVGARILPLVHRDYPDILRRIYDPPPVLYLRGALPENLLGPPESVRSVAIVGTRNASTYALHLAYELAKELAAAGVTVVSGLAKGIDAEAHRGAVSAGQTVAVLGSGVDTIYPRESLSLSREILSGRGAIVSEYPVGTEPRAEHFPARNRIVSGLCRAVVVVEGGHKSGAMITANLALEEGRTVFAVPGRVGDPRASGTLELIKGGAVLTQSAADILAEMDWTSGAATAPAPALSGSEEALVRLIQAREAPLLDDLMAASGESASSLLPRLTVLELKGVIKAVPGGRYISLLRG